MRYLILMIWISASGRRVRKTSTTAHARAVSVYWRWLGIMLGMGILDGRRHVGVRVGRRGWIKCRWTGYALRIR